MGVIAFDAKQFRRGKVIIIESEGRGIEKYLGFNSQLGVGVVIPNETTFNKKYIEKSRDLATNFGIKENLPFYSSTHLKQLLGLPKAISFADQLISEIQNEIETIHCSYVILPPKKNPMITVGGFQSPTKQIPTNHFIDNLGPMFSYLTAHSYLYAIDFDTSKNFEFHIDAFRSKHTRSWDNIVKALEPKIFWKGDECNPFISAADLIAFLTDAKLYAQRLKLEPRDIEKAWNVYSFNVKVNFYDDKSLSYYAWINNDPIDIITYLSKPTVFLSIDEIEKQNFGEELSLTNEIGVKDETQVRKFHQVIKKTEVYYSTLKYAFHKGGSMKIFKRDEDLKSIKDGDIFVYVGSKSKTIAETFADAFDIESLSGLELRKKVKNLSV